METRNLVRMFSWMLVMPIAYLILNIGLSNELRKEQNSKVDELITQCEDKEALLDPIRRASACDSILKASSKLKLKDEVISHIRNIVSIQNQEQLVRNVVVEFIDSSRAYNIFLYDNFIAYLCGETTDRLEENLNQKVSTYSFEINENNNDTLLIIATPNNNYLKSYYGVMAHQSARNMVHLALCESNNIKSDLVETPAIVEGKVNCSGNSKRVSNSNTIHFFWRIDLSSSKDSIVREKIERKQNSNLDQCFN